MFSKAVVFLEGISSEIKDVDGVKKNIATALRACGLSFTYQKPHTNGWVKLREEVNQPDTLYIFNDSAPYHLCEKPCVLLVRSGSWIQADPKPNCLAKITHELMASTPIELMGAISRKTSMRQHSGYDAAYTYLLWNQFFPENSGAMGRFGGAQLTWSEMRVKDIHMRFLPHQSEGLPFVSDMLAEGIACLENKDDILIITNSDICFVPEASTIIRNFMDNRNIDACCGQRVDTTYNRRLTFNDLIGVETYSGFDWFAFRPSFHGINLLCKTPLYLARHGWDAAWASVINYKMPFSVCYHWPHESDWQVSGAEGNLFNNMQIEKKIGLKMMSFGDSIGFPPQY